MTIENEDLYVTTKAGAAALVGVGAGLSSAVFALAFQAGHAAVISWLLIVGCGALAWIHHRVYGRRRP